MKFTRSLDGELRANLIVTHRVGRGELVTALMSLADENEDDHTRVPKLAAYTKDDIESWLRALLSNIGVDALAYLDERTAFYAENINEEVYRACDARVLELWPQLRQGA